MKRHTYQRITFSILITHLLLGSFLIAPQVMAQNTEQDVPRFTQPIGQITIISEPAQAEPAQLPEPTPTELHTSQPKATVQTPHQKPLAITDLQILHVTKNSVVASWNTTIPATGMVKYGQKSSKLKNIIPDPSFSTHHIAIISGLKKKKKYYLKIAAQSPDGSQTAESIILSAKTKKK